MSYTSTKICLIGQTDRILALAKFYNNDKKLPDFELVYLKDDFNFCKDLCFTEDGEIVINKLSIREKIKTKTNPWVVLKILLSSDDFTMSLNDLKSIEGYEQSSQNDLEKYAHHIRKRLREYNNGNDVIIVEENRKGIKKLDVKFTSTLNNPSFPIKSSNYYGFKVNEYIIRKVREYFEENNYLLIHSKENKALETVINQYISFENTIHHVIRYDLQRQNIFDNDYSIKKLEPINKKIIGNYKNESRIFRSLLEQSNKYTLLVFENFNKNHFGIIKDFKRECIGKAKVIISSNEELEKLKKLNNVMLLDVDKKENWKSFFPDLSTTNNETKLINSLSPDEALIVTSLFLVKDKKHDKDSITKLSFNSINRNKEIKGLIEKGVIKENDNKLRLDYDFESTLIEQEHMFGENGDSFLQSDSITKIIRNIFITGFYRDMDLLFITINQSSSISINKNITRKLCINDYVFEKIENAIKKNNENVNEKTVRLSLFPSHIETIIFNNMQFVISNLPKRRSLILCNNKSIILYDYDEKKEYMLYGKFEGKYRIAGYFGIFEDALELPSFVIYEEKKITNLKEEKKKLSTSRSLYELDKYKEIVDDALAKAINNYQYTGTIGHLEKLIDLLDEEITCENMIKNFELDSASRNDNGNIFEEAVHDIDKKLQSVDFLLAIPKIGLNKYFVSKYQTLMAYHHGVNEWSKGNIEKAISYYEDGLGIANDFIKNEQFKENELYSLYNIIANCANQLGNCYYEKIKETKQIEYLDYAIEIFDKAIINQKRFCVWRDATIQKNELDERYRYTMLAWMFNNKARIYSLDSKYYDAAIKMFEECYELLPHSMDNTKNKREADAIVAHHVNLNELIDKITIAKIRSTNKNKRAEILKEIETNDKQILQRFNDSFMLIDKYELNLSVKANALCNYINHYLFLMKYANDDFKEKVKNGKLRGKNANYKIDIADLYSLKNSLVLSNPRHVQRNKEIEELLNRF